jgi:hypothetical protein
VIESDRLSNPYNKLDTATLRGGVKIDEFGAPQAATGSARRTRATRTSTCTAQDLQWELIPARRPGAAGA